MRFLLPLALLLTIAARAPAQEIRAFWVDAFNEGIKSPEQVDTLLERMRRAHCNAVFVQVRKSGDAYYQSRYEPWASDNPQRFDGLADLIQKAHGETPRIAVHAWINTCAVGKSRGNPLHVTELHPDWLSLSDTGERHDGEAAKIDPGNPDAADWTARVYLDVARHYDVDGIHFDFVRYGGTDGKGRWGYNPVSVARFNARFGRSRQPAWEDPLWKQWRRDQVTALVRKVYAQAAHVRPGIVVSAATITWGDGPHEGTDPATGERYTREEFWQAKSAPMNRVFQDWRSWMREGILDLNCQMSYYRENRHGDYFRHWIEWGKDNRFGRFVAPAVGAWLNPEADSLRQINAIRKPSRLGNRAQGVMLYSYSGNDAAPDGSERQSDSFFTSLAQPETGRNRAPFARPAAIPLMPWKAHPKAAALMGYVLAGASGELLRPGDGALITLSGRVRRAMRADGAGFYAFVNLPPGRYRISLEGARPVEAQLYAGDSRWLDLNSETGKAWPNGLSDSAPGPIAAAGVPVLAGDDTIPGTLFVRNNSGSAVRIDVAAVPHLPIQAGDRIALAGEVLEQSGERYIQAAQVRFTGVIGPGASLAVGAMLAPGPEGIATVQGTVTQSTASRFSLDGNLPADVEMGLRKGPGVEDRPAALDLPGAGAVVRVTGVPIRTRSGETRIWPRTPADLQVIKPAPGASLGRAGRIIVLFGLAAAVCAAGLWLAARSRLRGTRPLPQGARRPPSSERPA